ncbi:MAG: transcription-repair coupling factor [Verrucomicrobia bacterium]|nr:transcription-repair coupling factor [Verrucomicrobiota bacterium]
MTSPFESALQLPEVLSLVARLEKGEVLSLHGVAESGKPFVIALLAAVTGRSLAVLASSVKQQECLHSELAALCPVFSRYHPSSQTIQLLHFPEMESRHSPEALPDLEITAEILGALSALQKGEGQPLVVTTAKAAQQGLPAPSRFRKAARIIRTGDRLEMEALVAELAARGYEREGQVSARGQIAQRGGILDVFPLHGESPVRIEFNGDEIESMRLFDVETQASVASVEKAELIEWNLLDAANEAARLADYLGERHVLWREPLDIRDPVEIRLETNGPRDAATEIPGNIVLEIFGHDFLATVSPDTVLREQRRELLLRHWRDWLAMEWRVAVFCNNEGEERRLREWTSVDGGIANAGTSSGATVWIQAPLLRGFSWLAAKLAALSDAEIFGRYQTLRMARLQQKMARARARREALDFSQFHENDLVVHAHHGIGRFLGVRKVDVGGVQQEVLTLEYDGGAMLHVPLEQAHLVGRYVGIGKAHPSLDQLGGARWEKAAGRAQQAVMDYAAELLRVEAERKADQGFSFAPDNEWQKEFEDSFLFKETPDQVTAIADAKADMESNRPMDRLICGDVGFGKTEVAIRAAFKAVMNGKQAAVLAPTTVLAQQHERTFRERMADYPVRIDILSRFRSRSEQRKTLAATREGAVDILIGTHRLLQPDVTFKNLGLVVVDEEQRFGVKHKEQFKQMFKLIDVLTLSATPIPRTLYLSLVGAKDISTIETPPPNRLPVETIIAAYDERLIRSAIEREFERGGQVFFLHNRVQSIERMRDRIRELTPAARVEIAHGQMDEDALEDVMMRFVAGEIDVLVATTIIESGLDIPHANTIIIDRADRFGLADLYQLRGRVGRSQMKAFAYLLLPRHIMIETHARQRISAIRQYSHLGAGFKVAMRDLEIRGAGNILGTEQSGHATAIGFELYCQLLRETLARLKGEKPPPRVDVHLRLDFLPVSEDHASNGIGAFIPRSYMPENRLRIEAYRRLAEVTHEKELRALLEQWRDRFGKPPKPVLWLMELAQIRLAAASRSIASVDVENGKVMMQKGGSYITVGGRFPRLETSAKANPSAAAGACLRQLLKLIASFGGT